MFCNKFSNAKEALETVKNINSVAEFIHNNNILTWIQSKTFFRNTDIRLSISYLYKIIIDNKYLLIKGNRIPNQYQPIGGVYQYFTEAKPFLESIHFIEDNAISHPEDPNDLRINIKGKYLPEFIRWFNSEENRETNPFREFHEELTHPGYLPENLFLYFECRIIYQVKTTIRKAKYMDGYEFMLADIISPKFNPEQKREIEKMVKENPQQFQLVTKTELQNKRIDNNTVIGSNGIWLLGEIDK